MADISGLGVLNAAEPLDMELYKNAGEARPFPRKGLYTLQANENIVFGKSKSGQLSAQIDPTIVGGANEGKKLFYTRIYATPFKRGGVTVSQVGDYLRACGIRQNVSGDPQELADAIEQTQNRVFEAELDWDVYDKGNGKTIEGMENFPKGADGEPQPWILSEIQKDEQGNPLRLFARLKVTRFVSAV